MRESRTGLYITSVAGVAVGVAASTVGRYLLNNHDMGSSYDALLETLQLRFNTTNSHIENLRTDHQNAIKTLTSLEQDISEVKGNYANERLANAQFRQATVQKLDVLLRSLPTDNGGIV